MRNVSRCVLPLRIFFLMVRRPPRSTQSRSSAASDVYKRQGLGRTRVRLIGEHRTPHVPAGDDVGVEGYRAEKWNAELLAHPLAAAAAEDICVLPAVRAGERAHVLDDAEDGDVQ